LAAAAFAVTAVVASAEPPPITVISPADGQTLAPSAGVVFEVMIPLARVPNVFVEVASQNRLGPYGELADNFRLERIDLFENGTNNPGTYLGASAFPPSLKQEWSLTPGTFTGR
jgi:hypothetical protein